jgi:2-amino-4-hydroxy-6-hydroxymethyldihydropteridine diphosphokinase
VTGPDTPSGSALSPRATTTVFVAIGSNLGDSRHLVQAACERLRARAAGDFRVSSLWKSKPVGCPPGAPDFINAAVSFRAHPEETPESLLRTLQQWEREFGRERTIRNAPRTLDLDLIAFGDASHQTTELTLPHPRAHLRRFVLEPIVELDPDLRLQGWVMTSRGYLAELPHAKDTVPIGPVFPDPGGRAS